MGDSGGSTTIMRRSSTPSNEVREEDNPPTIHLQLSLYTRAPGVVLSEKTMTDGVRLVPGRGGRIYFNVSRKL